jgi:hypothetical protein
MSILGVYPGPEALTRSNGVIEAHGENVAVTAVMCRVEDVETAGVHWGSAGIKLGARVAVV